MREVSMRWLVRVVVLALLAPAAAAASPQPQEAPDAPPLLRVFLDCERCFEDFIRDEVSFVEYVRDRTEADVHVIVTESTTGSRGNERSIELIGLGRFAGTDHSLTSVTESGDAEATERQRLATAITIGLLNYAAQGGVDGRLTVEASQDGISTGTVSTGDRWNAWVLSLRGSVAMSGEETNRERRVSAEIGADRITDAWKVTVGASLEFEREDFDLDEEEPLRASRDEKELETLVVKSLTDHWSVGVTGGAQSSSFENIDWAVNVAPAVEYNLFPYSAYNRRQLRMNYAIGPYRAWYVEETLFGKLSETLTQQEASVTLEQREPWGSLEVRFEASNYLPGFDRHRLEVEGDLTFRLARGLSLSLEGAASRLRDQLSISGTGATPEEILLRLRRLQSNYEYDLSVSLTYTFGSIFNTIVNPRFGE